MGSSAGSMKLNVPWALDGWGKLDVVNREYVEDILGTATGGVTVSSTPPANPTNGKLWFDSADPNLWVWYDSGVSQQWVIAVTGISGNFIEAPIDGLIYGRDGAAADWKPIVTVSPTAPTNPSNGQFWFDSADPNLWVWYNSGTTQQWVIAVTGIPGAIPRIETTLERLEARVSQLEAEIAVLRGRT